MSEQPPQLDTYGLAVKLAGMLLVQNGQITIDEIKSLPFVQSSQEAHAIAQRLAKVFGYRYHIEVAGGVGVGGAETRLRIISRDLGIASKKAPISV